MRESLNNSYQYTIVILFIILFVEPIQLIYKSTNITRYNPLNIK